MNGYLISSISKLETEPNYTQWGMNKECIESENIGFDPDLVISPRY